jgi:indolepyruvate ferredoxin oxidoreductase beta subunit
MVKNILLNGVGGQGIILVSEILIEALLNMGYDVKKNEIHGMSQRGGVVNSHVRYGDKVYSPIIPEGEADIIISFEYAETLRFINYLKPEGKLIFNTRKIIPITVSSGKYKYPDNVEELLEKYNINYEKFDAFSFAKQNGLSKAENIALLAYASKYIDIPEDVFYKSMKNRIKPQYFEKNWEIFKNVAKIYH